MTVFQRTQVKSRAGGSGQAASVSRWGFPQSQGKVGGPSRPDAPVALVIVHPASAARAVDNGPGEADGRSRGARLIRAADVTIALLILLFALPLMIIVAIALKIADPGPIFFSHPRIGRNGQTFRCHKFRSMVVDADKRLHELLERDPVAREKWERTRKLDKDPRITPVGWFLRVSSFDELPQLWNVIVGEMSLVGPRPIVAAEARYYGRYIKTYESVRPGITGLWQVSGRSGTSYRRRVALDVAFARNQSSTLYLAILVKTVPAVILARGSC